MLANRYDALPSPSLFTVEHLFRGVFAEHGGIVIPLTMFTPSAEAQGLLVGRTVERLAMSELHFDNEVSPSTLDAYAE